MRFGWRALVMVAAVALGSASPLAAPCVSGLFSSVQPADDSGKLYGLEVRLECEGKTLEGKVTEYAGERLGMWRAHGSYDPATQRVTLHVAAQYGPLELTLRRVGNDLEGIAVRRYKDRTSEELVRLVRKE